MTSARVGGSSAVTARVLVVCTANICRSPIAERLLAEYLVRQSPDAPISVSSAGTHARPGERASIGMRRVAHAWGLDLDYHRSRRVDADLVAAQDLVLTMEHAHRTTVAQLGPGAGQRTFLLTELAKLAAQTSVDSDLDLPTRVATWHAARSRLHLDAEDIDDPYGGPDPGYERTAWQLADLMERLAPHLSLPPPPPRPAPVFRTVS